MANPEDILDQPINMFASPRQLRDLIHRLATDPDFLSSFNVNPNALLQSYGFQLQQSQVRSTASMTQAAAQELLTQIDEAIANHASCCVPAHFFIYAGQVIQKSGL
jgi:hypothetical protein